MLEFIIMYFSSNSTHLLFDAQNVKCISKYNYYNQFYSDPCDIWIQYMTKPYKTNVQCAIYNDSSGNLHYMCFPNFGYKRHTIFVDYNIESICSKNSCHYDLHVNVTLYNPVHPIVHLILVIIYMFIFLKNATM
jgi:hypothetical protein